MPRWILSHKCFVALPSFCANAGSLWDVYHVTKHDSDARTLCDVWVASLAFRLAWRAIENMIAMPNTTNYFKVIQRRHVATQAVASEPAVRPPAIDGQPRLVVLLIDAKQLHNIDSSSQRRIHQPQLVQALCELGARVADRASPTPHPLRVAGQLGWSANRLSQPAP